jgi:hypothetical protein
MYGSIFVLGSAEFSNYKEYVPGIESQSWHISGSAPMYLKLLQDSSGSIDFSSDLEFNSSNYQYNAEGSIGLVGFSRNISSNKNYTNSLSLNLSGSANFCLNFYGTGGVQISFGSSLFLRQRFSPAGTFSLGGTLQESISPSRDYRPSLKLKATGSSYLSFSDLGIISTNISLASSVFDLKFEAKELEYKSELTIANALVEPPCGCGPLGLSILLTHNIQNSTVLSKFLTSNGLSISNQTNLRYKTQDNSWRSIQHFRGRSKDGFTFEDWTVFLTFQCQSELDAWRFSFVVKSANASIKEYLYTKLILDIPANLICSDGDVTTNIKTFIGSKKSQVTQGKEIYVVSPSHPTIKPSERTTTIVDGAFNDYSLYYDDIGLFKNSYWLYTPLEFNINPLNRAEMPTIDLQSIF